MKPAPPVTRTFTCFSRPTRRAPAGQWAATASSSLLRLEQRRHIGEPRHHPEVVAPLDPWRKRIIAHQPPDAGRAPGGDVAVAVADRPGTRQIERQIGGGLQDHAGAGLAPGVLTAVGADPRGGMVGAVIGCGDRHALPRELAAHPIHERGVVGLAIKTAADARLVGGDDDRKAARREGLGQRENALDEAALVSAVDIAGVLVDHPVAIEDQAAPAAGCDAHDQALSHGLRPGKHAGSAIACPRASAPLKGRAMKELLNFAKASPAAIAAFRGVETYVRSCGLNPALLELIRTRASEINGCAFCVDMHTPPGGRRRSTASASARRWPGPRR